MTDAEGGGGQSHVDDETFSVTRRTLTTNKPFDEFIGELEERSPVVPPSKFQELVDLNLPQDQLRAQVDLMNQCR